MALNIDEILNPAEQLSIARDTLRGKAADYMRLSLLDPASNGGPEYLATVEAEITNIKKRIKALEKKVPALPVPVAPSAEE